MSDDLEIVIHTRTIERTIWVLIVCVLLGLLIWKWGAPTSTGVSYEEHETMLAEQAEVIKDLEARLAASSESLSVLEQPQQPPPVVQTQPVVQPQTPSQVRSQSVTATWRHTGEYPSPTSFRLTDVELTVDNPFSQPITVAYELCWTNIECARTFTKGNITIESNAFVTRSVPITIPRIVLLNEQPRLRIVAFHNNTELLREEVLIR